jgi:ribosome-associated heat shock protein Hsp15
MVLSLQPGSNFAGFLFRFISSQWLLNYRNVTGLKKFNINLLLMPEKEKLRIDKYLWSIRLFKTRSLASEACDKGRVKLKGMSVKASKAVNVGDEYEVKTEAKKWQIKVTGLLHNRVQFAEAIKYYIDLTPEEELETVKVQAAAFHTGKRLSKIGRPTKKERRNLEDFTDPETAEE